MVRSRSNTSSRSGMSLVEIMIVVAILGIMAAMVVPKFTNTSDAARVNATAKDFRSFESAINVFAAKNNGSMPMSGTQLQSEIAQYLPQGSMGTSPPIGGMYTFHAWNDSDSAAVAVSDAKYPKLLEEIDSELDDGNLLTGRVRSAPNNTIVFYVFGPVHATFP